MLSTLLKLSKPSSYRTIHVTPTENDSATIYVEFSRYYEFFQNNFYFVIISALTLTIPLLYLIVRYNKGNNEQRALYSFTHAQSVHKTLINRNKGNQLSNAEKELARKAMDNYNSALDNTSNTELRCQILIERAKLYLLAKQYELSMQDCNDAILSYNNHYSKNAIDKNIKLLASYYFTRGLCYEDTKQFDSAKLDYNRAIELDNDWGFISNIAQRKQLEEFMQTNKTANADIKSNNNSDQQKAESKPASKNDKSDETKNLKAKKDK